VSTEPQHERSDDGDADGTSGTAQPFDGDHNHHEDDWDE